MTDRFIPVSEPWIDSAELEMLQQVIASTWVSEHAMTRRFESELCALTGARFAIAVPNGTLALYCALKTLGVEPGDEVIVPDLTCIATSNAVLLAGGVPVLADIDPVTFNLDAASIEPHITARTRGILPVHLYGIACDMDAIVSVARKHSLWVLEDAAEAVGVLYNGRHCGTFGHMGALSFFGNKTITTGEGGAVLTNNEPLAVACRRLKNYGRDERGVLIHEQVGYNFNFTDVQAALGVSQLQKLTRIIARKYEIRERYMKALSGIPGIRFTTVPEYTRPVHWFTNILVDDPEALGAHLKHKGIGTRRFFLPLHMQPCYASGPINIAPLARSRKAHARGMSLPSSYGLSESDQARVIEAVHEYFRGR